MNNFPVICTGMGLPKPVAEFRFAPPRRWRFDWAWPPALVSLEIEGGIWRGGRHTRGAGYEKDMEKYNAAAVLGFRVLRYTPAQMRELLFAADLKALLRPPS